VQISKSDSGNSVAISNLTAEGNITFFAKDDLDDKIYIYWGSSTNINRPFRYDDGYRQIFSLSMTDNYIDLSMHDEGFDSVSEIVSILVPIDASDPRLNLKRQCEGLPISWIVLGDALVPVDHKQMVPSAIILYTVSQSDSVLYDDNMGFVNWWRENEFPEIIVTDGPICGEESVWWQVTVAKQTAWIPDKHILLPDTAIEMYYSGALPLASEILNLSTDQ